MTMPSPTGFCARMSWITAPALRSASFLTASSGWAAKSGSNDSSTSVVPLYATNLTPASSNSCLRRGLVEARITFTGSVLVGMGCLLRSGGRDGLVRAGLRRAAGLQRSLRQGRSDAPVRKPNAHMRGWSKRRQKGYARSGLRRARNTAMGSTSTPFLLALTAKSPWMFSTKPLMGLPFSS